MSKIRLIPLSECIDRCLYKINSRNLAIGYFDLASKQFFGIREKFYNYFVDSELHAEAGGTAYALESCNEILPDNITLQRNNFSSLFEILKQKELQYLNYDVDAMIEKEKLILEQDALED